ncbi:MAG: SUF system Fe-S cluster assembly protein [Methyloligella sp. ZOD6]
MMDEENKQAEIEETAENGTETAAPAPSEAVESESTEAAEQGITHAHADLAPEEVERLTQDLVAALKTVYDPEIPVDIYELGLIYRVDIDENRNVEADMTLTAPGCPVAGEMPIWVENAIASVPGVGQVNVNLVFDPPWDMSMMSEEAKVALNMF